MLWVIGYLIVSTVWSIGLACVLQSSGGDFHPFFSRKYQRAVCFTVKQSIVICALSYTLMPIFAIGYWIYRLIRKIVRGR